MIGSSLGVVAGTRQTRRSRCPLLAVGLVLAGTLAVGPQGPVAQAQVPGRLTLAPDYEVQAIDSPEPAQGAQLAWLGMANGGDLDGDGKDDLLVPQYDGPGKIFVVSGATGELIRTLRPPAEDLAGNERGDGNFVYPAKIADLGSCPGGAANEVCSLGAVGAPDGVPDVLVGATSIDVEVDGVRVPDLGRAYVIDGATGAVLKKVQMPPEDARSEAAEFPGGKSFSFGRSIQSPASPFDTAAAVNIGDLDGGGQADFVVGNPTFYESGPATNPACDPGPCNGSGRVYFFPGEGVAGSDPAAVLDAPIEVVKNPAPVTDDPNESIGASHERFGHATFPIGDVGGCEVDPGPGVRCTSADASTDPDGIPDVVVASHRTPIGGAKAGAAWLFDGRTGALLRRFDHPEPQHGALFGYAVGTMPTAIGDVGGTPRADIMVPSVVQTGDVAGQGRAYVFNGNFNADPILSLLDDPTPHRGENFGAPFVGVGDVAGDPLNEVLVGAAGPWSPGDNLTFVGDVHVMDPITQEVVLTLDDPDQQPGAAFGNGVAQLGDVNDDGFIDFAVASGKYDGAELNQGRLYIFRSTAAAPPPPEPPPDELPPVQPTDALCAAVPGDDPFTDDDGTTFEDVIECLAHSGITLGTSETTYSPADDVTRAQMASFIARAIDTANELEIAPGVTELPGYDGTNRFSDVDAASVHVESINRLAAAEIVLGGPGGRPASEFGPELPISRAQMASFINRAHEFLTGTVLSTTSDFFDDDDGDVHEDNINGIASEGIAVGDGVSSYGPGTNVTRGQMAAFLMRHLAVLEEAGLISPLPAPAG